MKTDTLQNLRQLNARLKNVILFDQGDGLRRAIGSGGLGAGAGLTGGSPKNIAGVAKNVIKANGGPIKLLTKPRPGSLLEQLTKHGAFAP